MMGCAHDSEKPRTMARPADLIRYTHDKLRIGQNGYSFMGRDGQREVAKCHGQVKGGFDFGCSVIGGMRWTDLCAGLCHL